MKQLEPVEVKLKDEVEEILAKLKSGEEITFTEPEPSSFVRLVHLWNC